MKVKYLRIFFILFFSLSYMVSAQNNETRKEFTLLNWNVLYAFNHGKNVDEGIAWIKKQRPNVVTLQELNGLNDKKFKKIASGWGHPYAVLLKKKGFPVGLTSDKPIEVIEKRVKGFHHGYLHVKTYGIHFLVVHLWPGKDYESDIISGIAKKLIDSGEKVIVLGDFNSESSFDKDFIDTKPELTGKVNYHVLKKYTDIGLTDLVHKHDKSALISYPSPMVIPKWHPDMKSIEAIQHRIDFILASENLSENSISATIIRTSEVEKVSDHYPLIAKFE